MLKYYISRMYLLVLKLLTYKKKKRESFEEWDEQADAIHCEYQEYLQRNHQLNYSVRYIPAELESGFKWVGGQSIKDTQYGIPNSTTYMLVHCGKSDGVEWKGQLREGDFKWTGGCVYKEKVYGFPRTANSFIMYDPVRDEVKELPIDTNYTGEHHYGGVCTEQGVEIGRAHV